MRGICATRQSAGGEEGHKRKSCGEDYPESAPSAESALLAESAEASTVLTEPGETARLRAEVNSLGLENRLLRESVVSAAAAAAAAAELVWKQERAELRGQVARLRPG